MMAMSFNVHMLLHSVKLPTTNLLKKNLAMASPVTDDVRPPTKPITFPIYPTVYPFTPPAPPTALAPEELLSRGFPLDCPSWESNPVKTHHGLGLVMDARRK